jgi:phosphoribosylanthranilate isomerase
MTATSGVGRGQTRVKICGFTNLADAQVALAAGADLLGFIFHEKSSRHIDPGSVASIASVLKSSASTLHPPPSTPLPLLVGVFVNPSFEEVTRTLDSCGLDLAQLHGEEDPELLARLAGRAFKALRPRTIEEAEALAARFGSLGPTSGPDLLVDAYHPDVRGGAGQAGDWSLAARLAQRHRLLLAGGLTPKNVAEAISRVRPWGVDVASGVESAPGRKDHVKLREFIAAAKAVG